MMNFDDSEETENELNDDADSLKCLPVSNNKNCGIVVSPPRISNVHSKTITPRMSPKPTTIGVFKRVEARKFL
jgi:hypothetical protein